MTVAIDPNRIRDRAHALWLARGSSSGSAERDWLDAERELLAEEDARSSQVADSAPALRDSGVAPSAAPPASAPRVRIPSASSIPPSVPAPKPAAALPSTRSSTPASKPPRPAVRRTPSESASRSESEAPPQSTTAARSQRPAKAAGRGRTKRTG